MSFRNLKNEFSQENQVEEKEFIVSNKKIHIFYIDCLVDKQIFSNAVLNSITRAENPTLKNKKKNILEVLEKNIIGTTVVNKVYNKSEAIDEIYKGNAIIVTQECDYALLVSVAGGMKRTIQEPPTSAVVKGPREGFIEDIHTNKALIRKRLKTTDLSIKELQVGEKTKTIVNIMYLSSIADKKTVDVVEKKIKSINIDGILDSFYISQFLQKSQDKFFKRVGTTEKPDILVSKLLEGRVAILVDGSPIVLTVPFLLFEDIQSVEDYYDIFGPNEDTGCDTIFMTDGELNEFGEFLDGVYLFIKVLLTILS